MRQAVTRIAIVGFIISLVIMYATDYGVRGIQQYAPDIQLFDMQFHYTAETVRDIFENIGALGREAYQNYLAVDFAFILCFLIFMLSITSKRITNPQAKNIFIVLCFLRAALDITENTYFLFSINTYPAFNYTLASLCSWVSTLKFLALYSCISIVLVSFVISRFSKQKTITSRDHTALTANIV